MSNYIYFYTVVEHMAMMWKKPSLTSWSFCIFQPINSKSYFHITADRFPTTSFRLDSCFFPGLPLASPHYRKLQYAEKTNSRRLKMSGWRTRCSNMLLLLLLGRRSEKVRPVFVLTVMLKIKWQLQKNISQGPEKQYISVCICRGYCEYFLWSNDWALSDMLDIVQV